MRVLYFHQHFTTPRGAGGIRSYQMARALVVAGHQVTMVCGSYALGQTGLNGPFVRHQRRGVVDGIDIIEFDLSYANNDGFLKRSWTFLRYALGGAKVALREKHDLAFATTTPLTAAIPVLMGRWFRAKRYVFEVRDLWPELPRAMGVIRNPLVLAALSALEWLAYRNAERCIALSPGIAKGIAARGVDPARIALVPNGCDRSIFAVQVNPTRLPDTLPEQMVAVFTGTHGQANGLDAVLDAAAVLKRRGRTDIVLALIGDGKTKVALQARAAAEGLDNVRFHSPVPKQDMAEVMAGADVGLQILANVPAFYYGTSPNKFFDYLAAGLPVITNYPGWVADLVAGHKAGIAVPPDQAVAFADALIELADDPDRRKVMGSEAERLSREEFDRDKLANVWVQWVTQEGAC